MLRATLNLGNTDLQKKPMEQAPKSTQIKGFQLLYTHYKPLTWIPIWTIPLDSECTGTLLTTSTQYH